MTFFYFAHLVILKLFAPFILFCQKFVRLYDSFERTKLIFLLRVFPISLILDPFFLLSQYLVLIFSVPFDHSTPSLQLSLLWLLRMLVLRELFPTF